LAEYDTFMASLMHSGVSSKPIGVKTARAWAINDLFCWFWRHVYSKIARDLGRLLSDMVLARR
jgi:hypothetical protein